MSPAEIVPEFQQGQSMASNFPDLRGVRWRINLGVLPSSLSSTIDDLRRVTADSRRKYACLRKRLLIDPHVRKFGNDCQDLAVDNPLSQSPDSIWGRFFLNAELEQMVDKDLSRLYPEHGSYFQTPGCQGILRRILLLWCLRHPECGYRQGMHELLAPLLYVLHSDLQHLTEIRKLHGDHFVDKFDENLFRESHDFNFKITSNSSESDDSSQEQPRKHTNLSDLDANIQSIVRLTDPYGAEGELGIVLSERFMEHDAYCMFDALMNGTGGSVAMSAFFCHTPTSPIQTGSTPVIEASLALYHLLSMVDSSLYTHLVELGVEPQYFALRWLRVLFGREFSLEDLLVIWDEIFSFDNSTTSGNKATEHDSGVLNSPRGAFISAMAVSMMLHVRSSLLATEYATTCLQRLLNFPEKVNLEKLRGKAKSLVSLAMEANTPSNSTPLIEYGSPNKQTSMKAHHTYPHSLSFDLSSPRTPLDVVVPERYWEEKWKVVLEEEETKKKNSPNQALSKKRGWTEKIKMRLSRSESDPCPPKRESKQRHHKSSVRRSLLEDLAKQLNADEDDVEIRHDESSIHKDPLCVESDVEFKDEGEERISCIDKICSAQSAAIDEHSEDIVEERMSYIDKICSARSSSSEEFSPAFSEPTTPTENDTEKSSTESSTTSDDSASQKSFSSDSAIDEPLLPVSDIPDAISHEGFFDDDISKETQLAVSNDTKSKSNGVSRPENTQVEPQRGGSKEWKSLSNKFQWLFKFGRRTQNSGEGSSEKRLQNEEARSADGGHSTNEANCNPPNMKADGCDQNLAFTLRNLGQSMMDNIQVLESAFQQERNQGSPLEELSKHALVGKGQVTAMAALTELRKISNLLREM